MFQNTVVNMMKLLKRLFSVVTPAYLNLREREIREIYIKNINSSIGEKAFVQHSAWIWWVMEMFLNSVVWKHKEKNQKYEFRLQLTTFMEIFQLQQTGKRQQVPLYKPIIYYRLSIVLFCKNIMFAK